MAKCPTFALMHPQNPYAERYNLKELAKKYSELQNHLVKNPSGQDTIDFSSSKAVYALNKALLIADFKLSDYILPQGYLIPPVPGRLDYLLYIKDFMLKELKVPAAAKLRGLDIGCGANAIYCILGAQHCGWNMVGAESDAQAVAIAKANMHYAKSLENKVEIRFQEDKRFLLTNIVRPNERFDFTMCNPPFHASREEAVKGSLRKLKNLGVATHKEGYKLNFEGQANELWCNGGEALFIKRLIKESVLFKDQVRVFSSLVAKAENLPKIEKQLHKLKAQWHIIEMNLGNKKSRVILWWF